MNQTPSASVDPSDDRPADAASDVGPTAEVLVSCAGGVGRILVSNEKRRNALTLAMKRQLVDSFLRLDRDPDTRCIVLSGAGTMSFISGADLSEAEKTRSDAVLEAEYRKITTAAMLAPVKASKPVIASIRGACIGGGLQLAVSCDVRIAARNAFFMMPAARLGVGYPYAALALYVSLLGRGCASDLLLSARRICADEALDLGLINRLVEDHELDDAVSEYAETIAANAPLSLKLLKDSIRALTDIGLEDVPPSIQGQMDQCTSSQDMLEGRKAFLEKRKPNFQGR